MSKKLINEIKACTVCRDFLPFSPKPVFSFSPKSRIVLIGQAPGIKVHESGIPWNDASGKRLREWLNISSDEFYDETKFSIVPMGFCYPGNKGKGSRSTHPALIRRSWPGRQSTALRTSAERKMENRAEEWKTY